MDAANTPLSVSVLEQVLEGNQWTQDDLSEKSGVHRSTISMHLLSQRGVKPEQLVKYLRPLASHYRRMLLSAWLRDALGAELVSEILEPQTNRVREEIAEWAPQLSDDDRLMLSWLVAEFSRDPELAEVLRWILPRRRLSGCVVEGPPNNRGHDCQN